MMSLRYVQLLFATICFLETGCASVDQYGSRINDGNINSQNALNDEILLNIVRSSQYQSLNFIAISQINGGQTETLSTGLPTISIGPHQSAANHIYQISNSLSSQVTGGYQSNPLISTAFQNGLLTPISEREVTLLAAAHPRELVFYAVIQAIRIIDSKHNEALLVNDPTQDGFVENNEFVRDNSKCRAINPIDADIHHLFPGDVCSYSKFTSFLHTLVQNGLTADLERAGQAPVQITTGNSSTPSQGLPGHFCFDPSTASTSFQSFSTSNLEPKCSQLRSKSGNSTTETITTGTKVTTSGREENTSKSVSGPLKNSAQIPNASINYPGVGEVKVEFVTRSPAGVFSYLGKWLSDQNNAFFPGYATSQAIKAFGLGPYLDIRTDSSECYASVTYQGQIYCVPLGSTHTFALMDILEDLRNLNIQPSDLNSAFTVRIGQ